MLAYVLSKHGYPLMPCSSRKARLLLKQGKAKVVRRSPFQIQLLYGSSGYVQPAYRGVDSGYSHVGISAITPQREVFAADLKLRGDDIVKKNAERASNRRNRRGRKTWYRCPKWRYMPKGWKNNKPEGWFAPSLIHRMESTIRLIEFVGRLVPVTDRVPIEVAQFDIQNIKNPNINGVEYQQGELYGFRNVREYVLHRDDYTCQICGKESRKHKELILQLHHLKSRQTGGDRPENLITLCIKCHKLLHQGKAKLKKKVLKGFRPETFMTAVRWEMVRRLRAKGINAQPTYGYITKEKRKELDISKSHVNDAFVIADGTNQRRCVPMLGYQNRRNNRGIEQNRKGIGRCIRRQRYSFMSGALVRWNGKVYSGGFQSYGKAVKLKGERLPKKTSEVQLILYRRGIVLGYEGDQTLSVQH